MKVERFFKDTKLLSYLEEFIEIYKKRPFKNNIGGMGFNHSFALFSVIKELDIKKVYESGIYKGHSTWLIEQISDDIEIVAIDIDLDLREYISTSKNVTYYEGDLQDLSLKNDDKEKTLFFFDDHTNVLNRIIFLSAWNLKYAVFEDNYPPGQGDCYSVRKIKNNSGQSLYEWFPDYTPLKRKFRNKYLQKLFNISIDSKQALPYFLEKYPNYQNKLRAENKTDEILFNLLVENDYEIQPFYLYEKQRWGNEWTNQYKPLPPLIKDFKDSIHEKDLKIFQDESEGIFNYTYFSLVQLS